MKMHKAIPIAVVSKSIFDGEIKAARVGAIIKKALSSIIMLPATIQ